MPDGSDNLSGWLNPVAVAVGGGVGCLARYGLGCLTAGFPSNFPWITFGINVLGSFFLGLFVVWFRSHPQPVWYLLLGTGFCGGFTTFSTFSVETLDLIEKDRFGWAALYAGGSVASGLLAAAVAVRIAKAI